MKGFFLKFIPRTVIIIAMLVSFTNALIVSASEQPKAAVSGTLYLGGTGASIGILKILAKAYEDHYPGVKTLVYPSLGSGGGIKALEADKLTVSFSSRPLTQEESERGLTATKVLQTPLLIGTNPAIDISAVTSDQVANLFSGKTTNWANGTLVRPVLRPLKDADTQILMDRSDTLREALLTAHERTGKNVAATDSHAANEIEAIRGSFGITSLVLVRAEDRRINVLDLDGVSPTLENLDNGNYSMSKTIYAIQTPNSSALAKSFLAYLKTDEAMDLVKQNGGMPGGR